MAWVTFIWAAVAGACLAAAASHLFLALRSGQTGANLSAALAGLATAGMAACEVWMMTSTSPESFAAALRWFGVPLWLATLGLAGFVRYHLAPSRRWPGGVAAILATLALALNLILSPNAFFSSIESLEQTSFLGSQVSIPVGIPNPVMLFGQLALLLLAAHLADAALESNRKGNRRHALTIGTAMVFFVLTLSMETMMVLWGLFDAPVAASLFFLGIVAAMRLEIAECIVQEARRAKVLDDKCASLDRECTTLETIFRNAPGMLHVQSADGKIIRRNRRFAELVDGAASNNPPAAGLVRPAHRERFLATVERAAKEDAIHSTELDWMDPDGTFHRTLHAFRRAEIGGSPVLLGLGIPLGERLAERRDSDKRRGLATEHWHLQTLSKTLSDLSQSLGQSLMAGLANAEAALHATTSSRTPPRHLPQLIADIIGANHRAADALQRNRASLRPPIPSPVDPPSLLDAALANVEQELDRLDITITRRHRKRLPPVLADTPSIESILATMLAKIITSIAHTPDAPRSITLSCEPRDGDMRFGIRYRGEPLAPTQGDELFTPAANDILEVAEHTILNHGGRLWTESDRRKTGTTIFFTLPIAEEKP
jgi:PAS domain-containing protein